MAHPKPKRYRLAPASRHDLENIWQYTSRNWSVQQADRYLAMLEDSFDQLLAMPELAPERSDFSPSVRIHPSGRHLIVYRISGENLDILRILGGRQDWVSTLRAFES